MCYKTLLFLTTIFLSTAVSAQILKLQDQSKSLTKSEHEQIKRIARFERDLYNNLFNTSANDSVELKLSLVSPAEYKKIVQRYPRMHNTTGFYTDRTDECFVMKRSGYLNVIIHEFSHCFFRHNTVKAPRWVNEGIAEFCGSMVIDKDEVAYTASMKRLYPLKALISKSNLNLKRFMSEGDREWFGSGSTGMRYTISYSIIYFLIKKNPEILKQMLLLMNEGQNSYEALSNSYGSFSDFEEDYLKFYRDFISMPV